MSQQPIFVNTVERNGQPVALPKVIVEVRFKDAGGQWKSTFTLSVNDLPKAIAALEKASDYLLGSETEDVPESELQPAYQYVPPPAHAPSRQMHSVDKPHRASWHAGSTRR